MGCPGDSASSEAKAPSGARPAWVFGDEGDKYGKGLRPQGVRGKFPRLIAGVDKPPDIPYSYKK